MSSKSIIWLALGAFSMAVLYITFKPDPVVRTADSEIGTGRPVAGGGATTTAPDKSREITARPEIQSPVQAPVEAPLITIKVEQGKRVHGPTVIKVRQGQTVSLQVLSDHADELHLHGYDLHLHLQAGEPATLRWQADKAGRFEYELHHAGVELGVVEVHPR